jgi:hypothetical protein
MEKVYELDYEFVLKVKFLVLFLAPPFKRVNLNAK